VKPSWFMGTLFMIKRCDHLSCPLEYGSIINFSYVPTTYLEQIQPLFVRFW
jgi:hypothetical protein